MQWNDVIIDSLIGFQTRKAKIAYRTVNTRRLATEAMVLMIAVIADAMATDHVVRQFYSVGRRLWHTHTLGEWSDLQCSSAPVIICQTKRVISVLHQEGHASEKLWLITETVIIFVIFMLTAATSRKCSYKQSRDVSASALCWCRSKLHSSSRFIGSNW